MKDLYYILMYNNLGNTKECKTLIKHGFIQVNGVVETNCKRKIQEEDVAFSLSSLQAFSTA